MSAFSQLVSPYFLKRIVPISVVTALIFFAVYFGANPNARLIACWSISGSRGISSIVAMREKNKILCCCTDDSIRTVDLVTRQSEITYHGPIIARSIALDSTGEYLAMGCKDRKVRILNWKTKDVKFEFAGHQKEVASVDFSPDGTRLLSCTLFDPIVRIWDVKTGSQVREFQIHSEGAKVARFSTHGHGVCVGQWTGVIKCFDVETGQALFELNEHTYLSADIDKFMVTELVMLSPSDFGSCSRDGRVWVVNTENQKKLALDMKASLLALTADPICACLVAGDRFGRVHVWNWKSGKYFSFKAHNAAITGVHLQDSTHLLTVCGGVTLNDERTDGELALWQIQ